MLPIRVRQRLEKTSFFQVSSFPVAAYASTFCRKRQKGKTRGRRRFRRCRGGWEGGGPSQTPKFLPPPRLSPLSLARPKLFYVEGSFVGLSLVEGSLVEGSFVELSLVEDFLMEGSLMEGPLVESSLAEDSLVELSPSMKIFVTDCSLSTVASQGGRG